MLLDSGLCCHRQVFFFTLRQQVTTQRKRQEDGLPSRKIYGIGSVVAQLISLGLQYQKSEFSRWLSILLDEMALKRKEYRYLLCSSLKFNYDQSCLKKRLDIFFKFTAHMHFFQIVLQEPDNITNKCFHRILTTTWNFHSHTVHDLFI